MLNKKMLSNEVASLGETTTTKETTFANAANSIEELSDEALTGCVGGIDLGEPVQMLGWPFTWPPK